MKKVTLVEALTNFDLDIPSRDHLNSLFCNQSLLAEVYPDGVFAVIGRGRGAGFRPAAFRKLLTTQSTPEKAQKAESNWAGPNYSDIETLQIREG